jgi:hypothetical protein
MAQSLSGSLPEAKPKTAERIGEVLVRIWHTVEALCGSQGRRASRPGREDHYITCRASGCLCIVRMCSSHAFRPQTLQACVAGFEQPGVSHFGVCMTCCSFPELRSRLRFACRMHTRRRRWARRIPPGIPDGGYDASRPAMAASGVINPLARRPPPPLPDGGCQRCSRQRR